MPTGEVVQSRGCSDRGWGCGQQCEGFGQEVGSLITALLQPRVHLYQRTMRVPSLTDNSTLLVGALSSILFIIVVVGNTEQNIYPLKIVVWANVVFGCFTSSLFINGRHCLCGDLRFTKHSFLSLVGSTTILVVSLTICVAPAPRFFCCVPTGASNNRWHP